MGDITTVAKSEAPDTQAADASKASAVETSQPATTKDTSAAKVTQKTETEGLPTIEELLGRVSRLEKEKQDADGRAASFKAQFEQLRDRKIGEVEMSTTTTKPVLKFTVTGDPGTASFNVVDESEAKRLYCVRFKIDPSAVVLHVRCDEAEKRAKSIRAQFQRANAEAEQRAMGLTPEARIPLA